MCNSSFEPSISMPSSPRSRLAAPSAASRARPVSVPLAPVARDRTTSAVLSSAGLPPRRSFVASVANRTSTSPVARTASSRIVSISSCDDMTGHAGLTSGPGPSKPFDSMMPNCSPVAVRRKRIGLFHPGGVSMLRSRLYTAGPHPRAISIVRVLKFRVLGCHDVVSCFSISTDRTPHRASSSAAPRPTGPAPTMITRPKVSSVIALRSRSEVVVARGSGASRHSADAARSSVRASHPVELRHVVVEDELAFRLRHLAGVTGEQLARPRPRGVAVREVVGPHEPVRVEQAGHVEGGPVVLEGEVDVLTEILAGQAGKLQRAHVAVAIV